MTEVKFGPTGRLVYERTYSRVKQDGTREDWFDTVNRVVDGNLALVDERYQLPNERDDLISLMTDFKIIPAGRHLWASGVKNAQHLFNCWHSFWTEKPSDHFNFIFTRLMEGGGVGTNYSNKYLENYPPVQQDLFVEIVCDDEHPDYKKLKAAGVLSNEYDPDWGGAFVIEDSREGWASALVDLIDTHYRPDVEHYRRVYDITRVRAEGTKLRTFGGRASGPLPLAKMLIEVSGILSNLAYRGQKLDGISAMEIDHAVAQCVVSGGVRRCLPEGVRVNTTRGSVKIEDIQLGDNIVTPRGVSPVSAVFNQGVQALVEIQHAMGVFRCTPNHRVAVYDSLGSWIFKEAQDLTSDDHLVWDYHGTEWGVNKLPPVDHPIAARVSAGAGIDPGVVNRLKGQCSVIGCLANGVHIQTPEPLCNVHYLRKRKWGDPLLKTNHGIIGFETPELTPDFAWMVGLLQGDGTILQGEGRAKGISFAMHGEHSSMTERLVAILGEFGNPKVSQGNGNYHVVNLYNSRLADWCFTHVKQPSQPINTPEWIFHADSDIRGAYLSGLFDADGSCRTRPLNIVTTVYPTLVNDIIRLLASLGIASYQRETLRSGNWQDIYSVSVRGRENFNQAAEFLTKFSSKFESSNRITTGNGGNFGFAQEFSLSQGQARYGGEKNKIIPIRELERRGVNLGGAYPSRVTSINPIEGLYQTYDIEVNGIHQFTADGLVVHNSARMAMMHWRDPQVEEFISIKQATLSHWTTNISVEVDDDFWLLVNSLNNDICGDIAKRILQDITTGMVNNGEPGFWDSSVSNEGEPNPVQVTNPCGEIPLCPWEPCNLGHINLAGFITDNNKVDMLSLIKAHQLMTRFLIRATFSPVGDPKSREVLDRNRRIGVGHLGVASFLALMKMKYSEVAKNKWFKGLLRELAEVVDDSADSFSHDLRIPVPVKKRTVAPTGTISKMPGVSEGIHPIFSKYFNRRIRFSTVDPAQNATALEYAEQGYKVEPCQYAQNTVVIEIPTMDSLVQEVIDRHGASAEEFVEAADDLTLNEMLSAQAVYQTCWADNAVSFTANFDAGRYTPTDVAEQLSIFGGILKGATCFPESSMPQAPYERITREQYEKAVARDISDGVDEACSSGACPVR